MGNDKRGDFQTATGPYDSGPEYRTLGECMPRPCKKTLARMKAMADAGHTPNRIGKALGHDRKSIATWLRSTDFNDPEIKQMIEVVKSREIEELHLTGAKARTVLNGYLDDCLSGKKEPNPISVTAIMDRTFQQRRLLEGKSTENLSILSKLVTEAHKDDPEEKG